MHSPWTDSYKSVVESGRVNERALADVDVDVDVAVNVDVEVAARP